MSSIHDLATAGAALSALLGRVVTGGVGRLSDRDVVALAVVAGQLLRSVEGVLVETTRTIDERSRRDDDRLDLAYNCHSATELIERTTAVAPATIARWRSAARAITPRMSLVGEDLPPVLPAMRGELVAGRLGVDGLLAVAGPLMRIRDRVPADEIWQADEAIAEMVTRDPSAMEFRVDADGGGGGGLAPGDDDDARRDAGGGLSGDAGRATVCPITIQIPAAAETLKLHATAWACALDQDGAEPTEAVAAMKRSFTLGKLKDGVVRVYGNLLPEVAAQFQAIADAVTNPHGKPAGVRFRDVDETDREHRHPAQARHDALALALTVAAASKKLPKLGGAAPTLVVTVSATDLQANQGWAHAGQYPVPLHTARHVSCGGRIERVVFDEYGAIVSMGSEARVFNAHQRRAIATRDQTCVIPGCHVPASWCEVHHVVEWQDGGSTTTGNGVLLCWYHHRYLSRDGWNIQIRRGAVFVRPPNWIDRTRRWRAASRPHPQRRAESQPAIDRRLRT